MDNGLAFDGFNVGIRAGVFDPANVHTVWTVKKYDQDASEWASRRYGGAQAGKTGFIQPSEGFFVEKGVLPYEINVVEGNLVTTAGWLLNLNRITGNAVTTGAAGQAITATSGRIGAGDGTGTALVGDTTLSAAAGSAHQWFQIFSSGPTVATNVLSAVSTFGTGDGNFAWNEFGVDIGTPSVASGATVNACLWNHKTSIAQGTKASGCS